uniref:Uncharacterized protein n=1 Tax=Cucumis melo TaxID=3656 RepID=A0A9I9EHR4_CUCME
MMRRSNRLRASGITERGTRQSKEIYESLCNSEKETNTQMEAGSVERMKLKGMKKTKRFEVICVVTTTTKRSKTKYKVTTKVKRNGKEVMDEENKIFKMKDHSNEMEDTEDNIEEKEQKESRKEIGEQSKSHEEII